MPPSAPSNQLNKSFRLHLAALLYFLSRFMVVAFVFAVPALYFLRGSVEMPWVIGGAGASAILFLGYYIVASSLRCAACSSPVLMENGTRKHPHAARFPGLNHRARVAWDILFSSSYQCMYCVTRCRCKKGWGGKPARAATYGGAQSHATPEAFPNSIFGDVGEPVSEVPAPFAEAPPSEIPTMPGRTASGVFAAAKVFPNARTVPVSLIPAQPPSATSPSPGAATEPVTIEAPAAPEPPAPRPGSAPVPWAVPLYSTSVTETLMNQPMLETAPASNPFLAAAAAMPPPPTPPLPSIQAANTRPTSPPGSAFHQEFPHVAANTLPDGPPPWTIPSMPPAEHSAPVPAMHHPAPVPVFVTPAPQPAPAIPAADHLFKEVVNVLSEGQQAIAAAFQGVIAKLESRLAAAAPAPASFPAVVPYSPPPAAEDSAPAVLPSLFTAPQPAAPPVAPAPETMQPVLPELLTRAPRPSAPPAPAMRPQEQTSFVPLPNLPATYQVTPPPPVTNPIPVAATLLPGPLPAAPAPSAPAPVAPEAAPRRRFARPSGAAAQQLNDLLSGAFAEPALPPSPLNSGWQNSPSPVPQPGQGTTPASAPVPALPPEPMLPAAQRQYIPAQAPAPSPFGISDAPLHAPPGAPQQPAPFTFLKQDGDHFVPAQPAADPLDDSVLPWMQPIGAGHARI